MMMMMMMMMMKYVFTYMCFNVFYTLGDATIFIKSSFVLAYYANVTSFNWGCHMGFDEGSTLSVCRVKSLCLWLKQSCKLLDMRQTITSFTLSQ